jgi:N-acetylmuramoyl-L-alanine amidase
VYLDGNLLALEPPAFIDKQDRTQVPVRALASILGREVSWQEDRQEVVLSDGKSTVRLWIGRREVLVDDRRVLLDTAPVIVGDRTFVPLRFVAEAFGLAVEWNPQNRSVYLWQPRGKARVAADDVNLRGGPGTTYPVLTSLKKEAEVLLLGARGEWCRVLVPGGPSGWVAGRLLALDGLGAMPPSRDDPRPPLVTDVRVERNDGQTVVTVTGTAPLSYRTAELDDPPRLVLDFAPAVSGLSTNRLEVHTGPVVAVRSSQFDAQTVRVVLDLRRRTAPAIAPEDGGRSLKVDFGTWKDKPLVVLDPGHGEQIDFQRFDPGAVGPTGLQEHQVNLAVAREAGKYLTQQGVEVVYTRTGPTNLDLEGRAALANSQNADVFVSIHANASTKPEAQGTATYCYAPDAGPLAAQRSLRLKLAGMIQEELVQALGRPDLGVKEAGFAVLRLTNMPSALVEVAFISNPEEERLLRSPEFVRRAGEAIARGVLRYLYGGTRPAR